jgi:hypothetical protein
MRQVDTRPPAELSRISGNPLADNPSLSTVTLGTQRQFAAAHADRPESVGLLTRFGRIVDAKRPTRMALLPAMNVHKSGLSPDHRRIQRALDGDRGRGCVPLGIVLRVQNPVADVG